MRQNVQRANFSSAFILAQEQQWDNRFFKTPLVPFPFQFRSPLCAFLPFGSVSSQAFFCFIHAVNTHHVPHTPIPLASDLPSNRCAVMGYTNCSASPRALIQYSIIHFGVLTKLQVGCGTERLYEPLSVVRAYARFRPIPGASSSPHSRPATRVWWAVTHACVHPPAALRPRRHRNFEASIAPQRQDDCRLRKPCHSQKER